MVKIQVPEARADFLEWLAKQDIATLRYAHALADAIGAVDTSDPHVLASAILSRVAMGCPSLLPDAVENLERLFARGVAA